MTSTQLQIVPLALIMVMGPQILTAIFLVTSREPVKNSAAMLIGVFLAASLGLAIWTGVVQLISIDPSGNSGPGTGDYVVAGLLAVLAVRTVLTRGTATVPKWMSTLQHAEPRRAFSLGFLLILLMPTDIAATLATAHVLHDDGLSFVDGWPLVTATLALMAVPILGFLLLAIERGTRCRRSAIG